MGLGGVFDNGCGKVAQAAGWGGKLAMSSVVVIHVSELEAQGVNYHQGHSFTFANHHLRKGQAFSVARRGRFCILVEQDGMLTLCREESPVAQPPDAPVMQAETPSAKPLRWHFLFTPKVSAPLLPERYRRLPKEDQEVAQLLFHVRQHFPKR